MKKHHWNGSLITSTRRAPSSSAANGLFNLNSQQIYKRGSNWPQTPVPPYVQSGLSLHLDAGDLNSYVDYATSGTTWSDLSANSNDGTLVNMPTNAHTSSNGGYFSFDGLDDRVDGVHNSTTDITGDITIEAIFRIETLPSSGIPRYRVIGKGNSTQITYHLNYRLYGGYDYIMFEFERFGSGSVYNRLRYGFVYVALNTWYYVAAVSSGTNMELYLNNTSVATLTSTVSTYLSSTEPYTIGDEYSNTSTDPHNGDISAVRLYNRALTTTELTQNYNTDKGRWDGDIVSTDNVLHLDAGDLASYSGSGTTWTDLSTSSNNGTLQGSPAYDLYNQGSIIFDGVDDYVTTSSLSDSFLQGNWTISFWVKFDTLSTTGSGTTDEILLHHGSSSNNNGMHLVQRDGKILFGLYANDLITTATVSTGTWYHVTFTLNNTNYAKQIFIDGSLSTSHTGSAAYGGTGSNARIGGQVLTFGTYLNGNIANVLAYDTVLSATEIQQNYNAFKDRYGHKSVVTEGLALHLDAGHPDSYAGSGTTWSDLTSNNLDFALSGPVYNSGLGGYFTFDGGNDKAEVSSGWTSFDLDPFTIEIWYRYHTAAQYEAILGTQTGGSATFQVDFSGTSGQIRLRVDTTNIVSSAATAGANTWKQVVFVREGTGTNQFKIYLNGSLDTTGTLSTNFNDDSQLRIASNRGDNAFFDGDISIIRIYKNKGLTSDEVTQNYDAVKSRYGLS